jgi:hydrogenase maturation protease
MPFQDGDKPKARIAVVGVGNWLISYDRIGPKVLEICEGRYGTDVELFEAGSAGLALLDCIHRQDLMLVVDACNTGGKCGEIRLSEMDFEAEFSPGPGLHQIGPMETLAVARQLFPEALPRRVVFVLVETGGMSEAQLDEAGQRVLAVLDGEIERLQANCGEDSSPERIEA